MANSTVFLNTEIRKLKPAHRYALVDILNVSDSWKKLMAIIPRNGTDTTKFNSEQVSIIEQVARKYGQNAAEILLDEWGTMGRERPTLQILLDLLIKAELFRAADYVASEILNVDLPQRPETGPAAIIDISETLAKLISNQATLEKPHISTNKLHNKHITQNDFKSNPMILQSADKDLITFGTNAFSHVDITRSLKIDTTEENKFQHVQTIKGSSVDCTLQEMSSQELPTFLNNFEQARNMDNELKSEDLPAFLNQSSFLSHKSAIYSDTSNSLHLP